MPDAVRGQIIKATIVLAKGYEPSEELKKELQEHVKRTTAPYKYPRIIEFVSALPKTISNKIRRVELRERDAEKARADKAERELEEMRRQQMTEQERVVAERDDWRAKYEEQAAQLAARDLDLMRRDVAAEKNLPPALARRLYGTTREELEQDADALVALLPDPQAPRTPKPDLSAGSTGDSGKPSSVADAMARYQARRERSGATT